MKKKQIKVKEDVCPYCGGELLDSIDESLYWTDGNKVCRPVICNECDRQSEEVYVIKYTGNKYKKDFFVEKGIKIEPTPSED